LAIGLTIGIVFAWLIAPVQYFDTSPASLQDEFKEQYRALIAAAFAANGDLARAQARLSLLEDPNIGDTLAAQAQRALAAGADADEVRALAQLASVADAPPASVPTAVPLTQFPTLTNTPSQTLTLEATQTPTETPSPTQTSPPTPSLTTPASISSTPGTVTTTPSTPLPTLSPTITIPPPPPAIPSPTALSPFILEQRTLLCEAEIAGPLLIVQTSDNLENGIPGVEIVINWPAGEEHFFTGLKPELGLGYADFAMTPDIPYTLRLADGSQLITDLTASQCQATDGKTVWGSWELIFIQP
jgi:hypothetical protein